MQILITGGAGFVGSHLCNDLTNLGYRVRILDSLTEQIHGTSPLESDLYKKVKNKSEFIRGDVRNISVIKKALEGVEYVYHFVAETGTGQSMYQITDYTDVNIQGTANLLQCLVDNKTKPKKIILASSRSVYGEGEYKCIKCGVVTPEPRTVEKMVIGEWSLFCPECRNIIKPKPTKETAKIKPQSIYAITKYTQELLIKQFCNSYNIPFVILRYQNAYGPGQSLKNPYTGVLAVFANQILNNENPEVFEDGTEARDFVHISDVTQANISALERGDCDNEIINIGSGKPNTIMDAAKYMITCFGKNCKPVINGKFRIGDIYNCYADISKAKQLLNYSPKIKFKDGIKDFAVWVKEQQPDRVDLKNTLEILAEKGLYRKGKV